MLLNMSLEVARQLLTTSCMQGCMWGARLCCKSRGHLSMAGASAVGRSVRRHQRKIFLCEWYVKLVRPGRELPDNLVQCHVPMK